MPSPEEHRHQTAARGSLKRLLIRPGAIGDVIVSLPALEFLGGDVWVPSRCVPLIRGARSISSTGLDMVGLGDTPALDLMSTYDEIWSWYGTNRPDFREAVSHLPVRFHEAIPQDGLMHATDFYLNQVGAPLGAMPRISVERVAQGFVACHPFSGSAKKNWPLERFARLPVRMCVGPEQELNGAVRIENLYELAEWLASADAYVGNDSGITHLAAAVGTPTIALFGPTDPGVWAPRGPHVRVIRRDRIEDIAVEEVRECLEDILSR